MVGGVFFRRGGRDLLWKGVSDSQPRPSGGHARSSSCRRLCVLRLPHESQLCDDELCCHKWCDELCSAAVCAVQLCDDELCCHSCVMSCAVQLCDDELCCDEWAVTVQLCDDVLWWVRCDKWCCDELWWVVVWWVRCDERCCDVTSDVVMW